MRTRSLPLAAVLAVVWPVFASAADAPPSTLVVGTYTNKGKSQGIYTFRFDPGDGSLSPLSVTPAADPSWVLVSPDARFVYAVSEAHGGDGGKVSAFGFDAKTGALTPLNQALSGGDDPCYLSLSGDGQALFVANYSSGNLTALPVGTDGSLGAAQPAQVIAHDGHGPNPERQKSAHVHCVLPAPDGRVILATDLGEDRVYAYRYAAAKPGDAVLEPADPPFAVEPAGSGPRHLAFSADGRFVYEIHEMGETVTVNGYDHGRLTPVQTVKVADGPWPDDTGAAALHLSPDGRFLYASNRANANDVIIFAVNAADGTLTPAGRQDAGGKMPRDFAVDPSGRYLLVANQNSDNVVVFHRDADTGALTPTGKVYEVGAPVCLQFVETGGER